MQLYYRVREIVENLSKMEEQQNQKLDSMQIQLNEIKAQLKGIEDLINLVPKVPSKILKTVEKEPIAKPKPKVRK